MNVDEAMETAKAYLVAEEQCQEPLFTAEVVAITLAKEVERLRDENEWMGIAGQQMARHLAEAKAQLAAAKAASACPVEKYEIGINYKNEVTIYMHSRNDAESAFKWLQGCMKDTPPTA